MKSRLNFFIFISMGSVFNFFEFLSYSFELLFMFYIIICVKFNQPIGNTTHRHRNGELHVLLKDIGFCVLCKLEVNTRREKNLYVTRLESSLCDASNNDCYRATRIVIVAFISAISVKSVSIAMGHRSNVKQSTATLHIWIR